MKPLLVILGYAKASDMIARHWPYFLRANCDILGVGRVDTETVWPTERLVGTIQTGLDSYVNGSNLIELHLSAIHYCLDTMFVKHGYDRFFLTEPDAIFIKPVPVLPPGLHATLKGGNSPGFHGSFFVHGPWCFDGLTATQAEVYGARMVKAGLIERGFPDRFYGLMCDLYKEMQFRSLPDTYSQNLIDRPEYVEQARTAIRNGAWYIHGIKTAEQLRAVTEGLV